MNKLANTRKSKTHKFSLDLALTFFSQHTKQAKVTCPGSVGHCAVLSLFLLFCRATCLNQARAYMHIVLQSLLQIPAEAKTKINSSTSTCICICCKCIIPVFCKRRQSRNKRFSPKTSSCKTIWNKVQFGSCCCRANTSCEAKQIPNDFQKHHSHIQRPKTHSPKRLFSTKTFSTVNETCPDMMASCSFPENTKNNDLYLVRRRDLVKTNLNTSASYLLVNSRAKCSTHPSPNIVTAHRVYPYTFIISSSKVV